MHLHLSFTVLLASLITIFFSSDAFVDAAPVKRNTGMVSLPLRRVEARSGVHPQVVSIRAFSKKKIGTIHQCPV
jgi:hypothetical protein